MNLRVAGFQIAVGRDVQQNAAAICRALHQAHAAQAGILLTPEGSLSGYTPDFDPAAVEVGLSLITVAGAGLRPALTVGVRTALARELQVGLAHGKGRVWDSPLRGGRPLGTCFKETDGLTYNQLRFNTAHGKPTRGGRPHGAYLGFHSKILRCGSMTDPPQGEINWMIYIRVYAATPLSVFAFGDIRIWYGQVLNLPLLQ